jgi:hypothetical protein
MKTSNPMRHGPLFALCALAALGAGCANDQEERWANAGFGDSVRHTIALQTEYADSRGTGLDGQKAEAVLKAYREDVAKPKAAERRIRMQVDE